MIRIDNSLNVPIRASLIAHMSEVTRRESNLSFRSVKSIETNILDGNVFFALDNTKIIGWIETYHLWGTWWGLSSLYVEPGYRDAGVGRGKLLPHAIKSLRGKSIYAATTNQLVWEVLENHGFKLTTFTNYPLLVIVNLVYLRYLNIYSLKKLIHLSRKHIRYFYRPLS